MGARSSVQIIKVDTRDSTVNIFRNLLDGG
jgi:hypothetical protein